MISASTSTAGHCSGPVKPPTPSMSTDWMGTPWEWCFAGTVTSQGPLLSMLREGRCPRVGRQWGEGCILLRHVVTRWSLWTCGVGLLGARQCFQHCTQDPRLREQKAKSGWGWRTLGLRALLRGPCVCNLSTLIFGAAYILPKIQLKICHS